MTVLTAAEQQPLLRLRRRSSLPDDDIRCKAYQDQCGYDAPSRTKRSHGTEMRSRETEFSMT